MFFDFHSHQAVIASGIRNCFPGDEIPALGFYSMGLHPWYVSDLTIDVDIECVMMAVSDQRLLMIGECGLDKLIDVEWSLQINAFLRQLKLADQYKKPVVIHCVKATNEIFTLCRQFPNVKCAIHGFNGSPQLVLQAVRSGFYLSLGQKQMLGAKGAGRLMAIPIDRLFLETDDTNDDISRTYQLAAETMGVDVNELQVQLMVNLKNFGK